MQQDDRGDGYAALEWDTLWPDTDALLHRAVVDGIAARAWDGDAEGRLPEASLRDLRDAGYFGLAVPPEYGGGGAGVTECCAAQRRLSAADPALALAMNMHLFSVGVMVEHWWRARDTSWLLLEAIATQRRLVASAFAEPGLGGSILRSRCRARRVPGGYLVRGVKTPCSLVGRSDLICLQVEVDPPDRDGLMVALIPSVSPGLRVEQTWDTLGMRASESDTLHLEDCFIPDELVFHRCRPGFDADEVFSAGLGWFCVTTTATYLGVVEAVVHAVGGILQRTPIHHLGSVRAELPTFQSLLGDLAARVSTVEAACLGIAHLLDRKDRDVRSLLPMALALKHTAVEVCTQAVSEAMELVGAQAYRRGGALERFWRDVQALQFHPPTRPATRQILGKWALGLPFTFDLQEQPNVSPAARRPTEASP